MRKYLRLMDLVIEAGEDIITKKGKPISRLVPDKEKPKSLFCLHKENIKFSDDLIEPVNEEWSH